MNKYVRHNFYPHRVSKLEEEIKEVVILFYISDIMFQITMALVKILHSSFTRHSKFTQEHGKNSQPSSFSSLFFAHSFYECLFTISFLKIIFLSHIFSGSFSFLPDVLFSFFSRRERYVQMLDQIARQMIDFYKDMVTQRVMDQRILEELYNFKNVIEELTR